MAKIRRISLFGGPAVGKDATAYFLAGNLKRDNYNIELVSEYVKYWTKIKREPTPWDQITIFGRQFDKEYTTLKAGFETIVTSSPLLIACYYGLRSHCPAFQSLVDIAIAFEDEYPSLNIFLNRENLGYSELGRFHTKEEAIQIDTEMLDFIRDCGLQSIYHFKTVDREEIYNFVKRRLDE